MNGKGKMHSSINILEESIFSGTREALFPNQQDLSKSNLLGKLTAEDIESALLSVLEKDKKSKNPVFLKINNGIVSKLAQLAADNNKKVRIGLAGITASGKTTILKTSLTVLNRYGIKENLHYTRLNQDNYYKDTSALVKKYGGKSEFIDATGFNFDIPDSLDLDDLVHDISGNRYFERSYNKSTCEVCITDKPNILSKFIIVDGLFCLNPKMREAFDIGIYIHTSPDKVKRRWYARAKLRSNTGKAADFIYETAMKEAHTHIIPYSKNADITINGDLNIADLKSILREFVWALLQG